MVQKEEVRYPYVKPNLDPSFPYTKEEEVEEPGAEVPSRFSEDKNSLLVFSLQRLR
jgi:hypothetical protein